MWSRFSIKGFGMRYRVYKNGGLGLSNYSSRGAKLNKPIFLTATASSTEYAIRKDHTDATFSTLTATTLTSGTLSAAAVTPSISGDLSALSATTVNLSHRAPQGTYSKITVNAKGLVTGWANLVAGDIPNLSWGKFTSLPTTAGGYGITDALLSTGGTITGNITLASTTPTVWSEAASKAYTDTQVTILAAPYLKTGDIVIRNSAMSFSGYLRCNGGIVSKTAYAPLYAALGASSSFDTDNFKLPDLTTLENNGFAMFIRT